jgi:tryptophan synthase alpha chain
MSRLSKVFEQKIPKGEKILSFFVPAGYPEPTSTTDLVVAVAEAGADLIEIGVPFSDPLADGPTIQRASKIALENGITLKKILQVMPSIRAKSDVPLILMSYLNPIFSYGIPEFLHDAHASGADGLIIPDLIPEEYNSFRSVFEGSEIGVNFLVAPNSNIERIAAVDNLTRDFLYCVSITGVTGARGRFDHGLQEFIQRVSGIAHHPYLVGFGISNADQAREIAQLSHGIIIGSALIDFISRHSDEAEMLTAVKEFVREMKTAIAGA